MIVKHEFKHQPKTGFPKLWNDLFLVRHNSLAEWSNCDSQWVSHIFLDLAYVRRFAAFFSCIRKTLHINLFNGLEIQRAVTPAVYFSEAIWDKR